MPVCTLKYNRQQIEKLFVLYVLYALELLMRLSLIIILHESNKARNKDVLNKKEQI